VSTLSSIQCYLLIEEAIEAEITLKVGITLPQAGQQATRESFGFNDYIACYHEFCFFFNITILFI
jgi:hypothetical protein